MGGKGWTKEEEKILIKHYIDFSTEDLKLLLPNRTIFSIHKKAKTLKIRKLEQWTLEEDEMLTNNYLNLTVQELRKLLPNRTCNAIELRTKKLKLVKNSQWSKDEDKILINFYPNCTLNELLNLLPNKNQHHILYRIKRLKIQKDKPDWTVKEDALLENIYKETSNEELEKIFNRSIKAIQIRASKLGVNKSNIWTNEELQKLKDNFNNNNKEVILKMFPQRDYFNIYNKANQLGLSKERGSYNYFINENFFNPLTPESTYVLGFIYADGYVRDYDLIIKIKDLSLLEDIKKSMSSEHPIKHRFNKEFDIYDFQVGSKKIVQDLNKYGVVQRKSLIIQLPILPDELMPHFIRGYFDGDGSVSINCNNRLAITFTSGSIKFLEQLQDYFKNNQNFINRKIFIKKDCNCGVLNISSHNYEEFFNLIYNDATIYLDRKYKKFLQYGLTDILQSSFIKGDFLISQAI